jgi:hypothetical protein
MHCRTYALTSKSAYSAWRFIIFLVVCIAFPAVAYSAGAVCAKGPPEHVDAMARSLRPIQTAQCPYGFDDFVTRLMALITDKQSTDSVETTKAAFGLPDMTTAYDDPRIAAYTLDVSGKDGWKVRIGVDEGFYPLNKGPARFVPGIHPRCLYKVTDATLRIDLRIFAFQREPWISNECPSVNDLESALEKAGWEMVRPLPASDAYDTSVYFQYKNKAVSLSTECSKLVPEAIQLSQKPTDG